MLQSRVGFSIRQLAQEVEVAPRTVFRDLGLLKKAGIPIWYDQARHGYSLSPACQIKTSPLSPDELAAVMVAAHVFSLSCGGELGSLVRESMGKLLVQTPASIQGELVNLLQAIIDDMPATPDAISSPPAIREIFLAIRQKRQIRIVYDSEDEIVRPVRTKVIPQQLVATQGSWYLIGRSSWHRKVCRFDLRHILSTEQVASSCESAEIAANAPK